MRSRILRASFCCVFAAMAVATWATPPQSDESAIRDKVEGLLKQMTLQEKVDMCHGGSSFATKRIARLGIQPWNMTDGPGGVRTDSPNTSTYFPTGTSLASTWDPLLIYRVGQAMGQEARFFHKDVLLGPAVNMIRTPLCGRSFEYMSEDPFLAGSLAVPYIRGVQSQGVAACVKHFAANSQEIERGTIDAQVSERALQEIYLPAFKAAVQDGHVLAIMDAYNRLQGIYCTANSHLNNEILKQDWGFQGVVMSDWGATHDTVGAALGGLDLEMPGGGPDDFMAEPLFRAVKAGQVPESVIDDKVRRILRAELITDEGKPDGKAEVNSAAHQQIALEVAESSIVLLKNDKSTLPLNEKELNSLAVIGPWATAHHGGGGGSSAVYPPFEITALEGITARVGSIFKIRTAEGAGFGAARLRTVPSSVLFADASSTQNGLTAQYYNNRDLSGAPKLTRVDPTVHFTWTGHNPAPGIGSDDFSVMWTGILVAPKTGMYELGTTSDDGSRVTLDGKLLVDNWGDHAVESKSASIMLTAGSKHALKIEYYQAAGDAEVSFGWNPPADSAKSSIQEAVDVARTSDAAVVFVGTNHRWDTEGSDKPSLKLMGDQEKLVQAIVAANPKTVVVLINGSAVEVASWIKKVPAVVEAWYPGMEGGKAIAEILFGDVNPSGKLAETFPVKLEDSPAHANGDYPGKDGKLKYDEGVYIGYRYFDSKNIKPQFPFGYGLSYTKFRYSNIKVEWPTPTTPVISADVKNVGKVAGAEVVELYVHQEKTTVDRPEQELKGYQKVLLKSGQSQSVQIPLERASFAYFDPNKKKWTVDKGMFDIRLGSSSRDIRLHAAINYPLN